MSNTQYTKQDDFITITELWYLCRQHWRWFVLSLAVFVGFAEYYLQTTTKMYTREAAVLVKLETGGRTSTAKNGEEFKDLSLVQQTTNINNVQRHLQSLDVAMGVVEKLHLAEGSGVQKKAQSILDKLKVQLEDKESTVINLKYVSADPKQAEQILSAIVDVYNEKWQEDRNSIVLNTSKFIIDRLSLLSDELEGIDDSISVFKSNNQITDLDRVSDIYLQQQSQSEAQILTLSNQKAIAEYILSIVKDKSASHQLLPTNSGINNQAAETQIAQYNNQILQINNHLAYTSEQNPIVGRMEKELSELRKNILRTVESHIKTLDIQLSSLHGFSGKAEDKITDNPDQAKRLTSIERQQKVKESLYLYLLQKKEENEIASTYNTPTITQMIDIPHGSNLPTSPNNRNVLFIAVLMGVLLPTVVIFLRANMDNSVRDRRDLERKTTIPLVGDIPMCSKSVIADAQRQIAETFGQEYKRKLHASVRPIVVSPGLHNKVNEAFRVIRTNLEFMTDEKSHLHNVFVVTSNNANSGKTFVSMNLAIAMAIVQKNVLFIDADLRHASSSASWFQGKKDGGLGLSDYLSGKVDDIHSVLRRHPNYETLDFLPVGTIPPNPTELLSSNRLGDMIEALRYEYDYILIDCPPAVQLADTTLIERYADRTLFVIRVGLFDRSRLANLEDDYAVGKYKNMSIILNSSKPNHHGSGNGYDYDYETAYYGKDNKRGFHNPFKGMLDKVTPEKLSLLWPFGLLTLGLTSCNDETYSELDRVKTGFLESIKGQIDSSHLWRTAVKVKVKITSDRPVTVSSQVVADKRRIVTDYKNLGSGSGEVVLTVPQGMGNAVYIQALNSAKSKTISLSLTGALEQTVTIDLTSSAKSPVCEVKDSPLNLGVMPNGEEVMDVETHSSTDVTCPMNPTRAESTFNPDDYATHDPDPSLYGKSICGGGYYKDWNLSDWHYICDLAITSYNLEESGEIVNYELISKGRFSITLLCGYKKITSPRIFGYYYHSPGTYDDLTFVDMFDTHSYDFLDDKGLIQYQINGNANWYTLNYQIGDMPGDDKEVDKVRQGDNVFNSIAISRYYRDCISKVRGLTYDIDVPAGMRIGFYMREDNRTEPQQYRHLLDLGLPTTKLHYPFKATNFSVKQFNLGGTHRSWIHDSNGWYFMGMEDIIEGGDFDDNDMMFGITDPIGIDNLPEIVDPDIDHDKETGPTNIENLPWTLAFEDIYRNADFDFNDGVIRIDPDYENETACVTVLAAGIDEQVFLHYAAPDGTDMVLGELHELLGRTSDRPVNTGSSSLEVPGVQVDCVPWPEGFTMANDASRFTLEVIRGNCHGECSDWLTLYDDPGQVPEAILVAGNWQWPKEGVHITNTYFQFNNWAKDATNPAYWEWYHTPKTGTYVSY